MQRIENPGLRTILAIVGTSLTVVDRDEWTSIFEFAIPSDQSQSTGPTASNHAWSLHVECAWRFIDGGTIVTGSQDHFDSPGYEPRESSITHLEHKLTEWLPKWSPENRQVNDPERFVVASVATSKYYDVDIGFSSGIRLQVFPDGTGESWSFFANDEPTRKFIISGGRISPCA